jgi:protein-tyrosine phosphatase
MLATLQAIAGALAEGGTVYIHCRAGIGRTGTVAGCLLVEHGFAGDEALALLQRKFGAMAKSAWVGRTPETQAQRAFVAGWTPAVRSA